MLRFQRIHQLKLKNFCKTIIYQNCYSTSRQCFPRLILTESYFLRVYVTWKKETSVFSIGKKVKGQNQRIVNLFQYSQKSHSTRNPAQKPTVFQRYMTLIIRQVFTLEFYCFLVTNNSVCNKNLTYRFLKQVVLRYHLLQYPFIFVICTL